MQPNANLKPLKYEDVEVGQWVIVSYEDEKFIEKVIKKGEWEFNLKTKKSFMVICLEITLGIATPQRYEKGDPIFHRVHHTVYETDKPPYQT